jgi:LPS export ABC transporter protein LptC
MRYFISILAIWIVSCDNPEQKKPLIYEGPMREVENLELYHTENEKIKLKMMAPVFNELLNGDKEFPKGLDLQFYNELGKIKSTLHANNAYYFKEKDQWRGRGDVEVKNLESNEQLNTEELFWKQSEQKIFTDKFVTIRQQNDVIYGEGLEAKEDLSDWDILKMRGKLQVKE